MATMAPAKSASRAPDRVHVASTTNVIGWRLLGWIGVVFFIFGMTDIALGWYPAGLGNPEWEFGVLSATLNGLALPTLGLYLALGFAFAANRPGLARGIGAVMLVLSIALLAVAFTYLTVVPLALSSVRQNAVAALGMKKAIVKACLLLVGYLALYITATLRAFRRVPT